jgi:type I restriction enzyme S subunit
MPSDIPDVMSELTIPTGWDCALLGSLVEEKPGISYGIVQPGKHDSNGIPIVRVNNLRTGRILVDDVLRVGTKIEANYSRTRLRGGEVLLSLVGTLGECAVVPKELAGWNVARAVAVIPLQVNIDPHWVAMCLRSASVRNLIRAWATTTVQATLNLRDVRRLPILLAPQPDRDHITQVIKQLDDKIEQNRRTARALERLARAIFRAWFVDFEPIKAKAAGATAFPSMPQPVFDALPTRFVDSDIGPVPEGWDVGAVSDLAMLSKEQVRPQESTEELFKHFSIPAFDAGRNPVVERGAAIKSNKFLVLDGCVLLSKLNPRIPRVWLPPVPEAERQIASTEFLVLIPNNGFDRHYLYCKFQQPAFRDDLAQSASGTSNSHQRVRPNDLLAKPVVMPPAIARDSFQDIVAPLFALLASNHKESRQLAELRDYLLPKILSGELRVKDAATTAEELL